MRALLYWMPQMPCGELRLPARRHGIHPLLEGAFSFAASKTKCNPHPQEIDRRLEKKLKITQKERAGSSRLDVATAMGKPFKKKTLKGRNVRKSKSPPKVPIVIQDDSLPAGPPPQIRILKRPTTNGVLSNPNSASRPAFPVKSLAQREAEYAEARKRILGSASPEEEQEKPILDRPPRISQPEDTRQPNNVIRQPLGPDGSQGFKQRR
ncbi:SUZ domain-containing protein 1 isoform X1 [Egretta garzetta]|uniref:SUZ domain-containing protein 1 isoform X1 n=1 Tax=Egretta garzetta TaxID=188379 RepID=UPI00163D3452|nr:SUZ domain-containing protein 1 isoform X1 [Egretta garzetta]